MIEHITREEAIDEIMAISEGRGVDRYDREYPRGRIAENLWDNDDFCLGMEYGAKIILMQLFDLQREDLK